MIAPFLATLNIALRASKSLASPAGGTAYLALTVRSADLLNSFLLALCGSTSFAMLVVDQVTYGSNPQRTTTCQSKNCSSFVTVPPHLWNSRKVSISKSECIKSITLYNTTCSLHEHHYPIKLIL